MLVSFPQLYQCVPHPSAQVSWRFTPEDRDNIECHTSLQVYRHPAVLQGFETASLVPEGIPYKIRYSREHPGHYVLVGPIPNGRAEGHGADQQTVKTDEEYVGDIEIFTSTKYPRIAAPRNVKWFFYRNDFRNDLLGWSILFGQSHILTRNGSLADGTFSRSRPARGMKYLATDAFVSLL